MPNTLLVFVHGFLGSDASFGSFPADLQSHLRTFHSIDNIDVRIYPAFESKGDHSATVNELVQWFNVNATCTPPHLSSDSNGEGESKGAVTYDGVIILGHSIGGIFAVDAFARMAGLADANGKAKPRPKPVDVSEAIVVKHNDNASSEKSDGEGNETASETAVEGQTLPASTTGSTIASFTSFNCGAVNVFGIVSFDSPFFGIHPRVFVVTAGAKAATSVASMLPPVPPLPPIPDSVKQLPSTSAQAARAAYSALPGALSGIPGAISGLPKAVSSMSPVILKSWSFSRRGTAKDGESGSGVGKTEGEGEGKADHEATNISTLVSVAEPELEVGVELTSGEGVGPETAVLESAIETLTVVPGTASDIINESKGSGAAEVQPTKPVEVNEAEIATAQMEPSPNTDQQPQSTEAAMSEIVDAIVSDALATASANPKVPPTTEAEMAAIVDSIITNAIASAPSNPNGPSDTAATTAEVATTEPNLWMPWITIGLTAGAIGAAAYYTGGLSIAIPLAQRVAIAWALSHVNVGRKYLQFLRPVWGASESELRDRVEMIAEEVEGDRLEFKCFYVELPPLAPAASTSEMKTLDNTTKNDALLFSAPADESESAEKGKKDPIATVASMEPTSTVPEQVATKESLAHPPNSESASLLHEEPASAPALPPRPESEPEQQESATTPPPLPPRDDNVPKLTTEDESALDAEDDPSTDPELTKLITDPTLPKPKRRKSLRTLLAPPPSNRTFCYPPPAPNDADTSSVALRIPKMFDTVPSDCQDEIAGHMFMFDPSVNPGHYPVLVATVAKECADVIRRGRARWREIEGNGNK
ncbi:hypothetical protein BJ742DRAFT_738937 [Cladochytrium replicatum]|nr:hypothetical protein BJ742DRAFT_738937 [Cladochytrium replicatum]